MIHTVEGVLQDVHTMLQRIRELVVQAANYTLSSNDRTAINTELQQHKEQINAICSRTELNGKALLTGVLSITSRSTCEIKENVSLSPAAGDTPVKPVDVSRAQADKTYAPTSRQSDVTLTRSEGNVAQTVMVCAIVAHGSQEINCSSLGVKITIGSNAGVVPANLADALDAPTNDTVTTETGSGSVNFQSGGDSSDFLSVSFDRVDISAFGLSKLNAELSNFNNTPSVVNAQELVTAIDGAIDTVNTKRANFGARQNHLGHTVANLGWRRRTWWRPSRRLGTQTSRPRRATSSRPQLSSNQARPFSRRPPRRYFRSYRCCRRDTRTER